MNLGFAGIFLLALLLPMGTVAALEPPQVTFIPGRFGNDSVIMVAQGVSGQSVRVTWTVPGNAGGKGQLPKVGNKWMCIFSSDARNTCGPTPFLLATKDWGLNYSLLVEAFDETGARSNTSMQVEVGGVRLTADALNLNTSTNTLYMGFYTDAAVGGVDYKVYYAANASPVGKEGALVQQEDSGRYNGQTLLDGGDYFIAFTAPPRASTPSLFGGMVRKVSVPVVAPTTGGGGTVTPAEGASVFADPFVARPLLQKGERFVGPAIRVINQKNQTFVNVSFSIPANLRDFFSVERDDLSPMPFTLAPLDTVFFRWTVKNVSAATDFNFFADVVSGETILGQVKVNVSVSVVREAGSGLAINPEPFVTGEFLLGNVSRTFDLTNMGGKPLSGFTFSFSDVELNRSVLATAPASLATKEKKALTLLLSPSSAGRKSGVVTLTGSGEMVKVYVDVIFYPDLNASVENTQTELDEFIAGLSSAAALKAGTDKVEDTIADARLAFEGGRYREAELTLAEASGMIAALKTSGVTTAGGGDGTTAGGTGGGTAEVTPPFVLIAVLLIVVIGGLVLFLRKRGKGGGDMEEIEKELKEGGF